MKHLSTPVMRMKYSIYDTYTFNKFTLLSVISNKNVWGWIIYEKCIKNIY
jgi:hypothetical protein